MAARPAILDILNCYGPGGRNIAQLVTYADGSLNAYGDAAFLRAALHRHRAPIGPTLTAALQRCDRDHLRPSSRILKRRPSKAPSSDPSVLSQTADAAE